MERRLAAILAADVVGYSRAMEANEEETLARLQTLRNDLFKPKVEEYHGRIFKTTGDGAFVEFASSIDALRCALDVQRGVRARNDCHSTDQFLLLRIGINVGDVIVDDGDVYGNSVNVAARLEGLAPPGGICLSEKSYRQVHGSVEVPFDDLGEQPLKNVMQPVRVYRVSADSQGSSAAAPGISNRGSEKPSIAVLPLENMSGDPKQDFFADGIAEDLITALSKLEQLRVIARNSSFTYKGRMVKVQEIGADLGVRYLVEGSVRKAGNRVRINAQLINCEDGTHLWAERYDRELSDIFEVQDDVTRDIVSALEVRLKTGDLKRLRSRDTANLEAYELFLKGRAALYKHRQEDNKRAIKLLEAASDLDPGFAPPLAFLCNALLIEYINEWADKPDEALERSHQIAENAVEIDPSYPWGRVALGNTFLWMGKLDEAIALYKRAVELDPNFADAYMTLGWTLHFAGRAEEAIELIERGLLLDPNYSPMRLHWLAQCLFQLGRYKEAAEKLQLRLARQPHSDVSHALLAATYGHMNDAEAAKLQWAKLLCVNPNFSVERRRKILPYRNSGDFDRFVEGLIKAGIDPD
jgi:adenylate cyclase